MTNEELRREEEKHARQIAEELESIVDQWGFNGLLDYFADLVEYDFRVDGAKRYLSARLWVTLGGPNICIDTEESAVNIYWAGGSAWWGLSTKAKDEIDQFARVCLFND